MLEAVLEDIPAIRMSPAVAGAGRAKVMPTRPTTTAAAAAT
jgi:hypothetical protein